MNSDSSERLHADIEIDAPPADVWAIVSDLKRMGEWSPQCRRMYVFGGDVTQGTRTLNINAQGKLRWPTSAKVIEFDPGRLLSFRINENRTVWSYRLEPNGAGTLLTETRRAPRGVSALSRMLIGRFLGGTGSFDDSLRKGMIQTLSRIKAEAES